MNQVTARPDRTRNEFVSGPLPANFRFMILKSILNGPIYRVFLKEEVHWITVSPMTGLKLIRLMVKLFWLGHI